MALYLRPFPRPDMEIPVANVQFDRPPGRLNLDAQ